MNSGIKYRLRQKALLKVIDRSKREVVFPRLTSIQSIGVVVEHEVDSSLFNQFSKLEQLIVLPYDEGVRMKGDTSGNIFSSDLSFIGLPSKSLIKSFVDHPFDLLINLSILQNDAIDYICAKSIAKFKVSKRFNNKIYDLVIDEVGLSTSNFIAEIIKTLNNFRGVLKIKH